VTVAPARRVRRDGAAAMLVFFAGPFLAVAAAAACHPLEILDSEDAVLRRTAAWRPQAERAAGEAGVPADLLLALVATESSGRPGAVSSAGAVGLAQVLPATARGEAARLGWRDPLSLDLHDPEVNLRLGAAYLADQRDTFGDDALALAAYHSGPGVPAGWRRAAPGRAGLDLVRERATPRTRAYVERVLRRRAWFAAEPPGGARE
jgi:soluble lytic murein transglycosylase